MRAGQWDPEEAETHAAAAYDALLPQGIATPGMQFLAAENGARDVVGFVWVALESAESAGAWIYDIVIWAEHRGHGYGRALLAATEGEVAERGIAFLGLNVFGANHVARRLYESSGYETVALQMRKALPSDPAARVASSSTSD